MTIPLIDDLRRLHSKATPGQWFALWKDNGTTTFEFVGVPTAGNILHGCEATEVAGLEVVKGSREQARTHADIAYIEAMQNALPHLLTLLEAALAECEAWRAAWTEWAQDQRYVWADNAPCRLVYDARAATDAAREAVRGYKT